jgi:hypothetical protein
MSTGVKGVNRNEQVEPFIKEAREQLASMRRHIKDLAESNHVLTQPTSEEFTFKGQMGIRSAFIVTEVNGYVLVGPMRLNFSGHAWGVAVNIGEYIGGGTFGYIPPQEVVGDCTFEVHAVGVGAGMLQVTWLRGSQILGTFLGGGPTIGVTLPSGGSGKWSIASE